MIIFSIIFAGIKAVGRVIVFGCKIVYRILKLLRIRLLALYLVACGFCQLFFHAFSGYTLAIFWVGFATCVLISLLSWFLSFRERNKRRKLTRLANSPLPVEEDVLQAPIPPSPAYPQYYGVEGKKDYMFAEYEDRYELYRQKGRGWILVQTDYKRR